VEEGSTMRNTVFGILCDELGHAADELLEQGPSRPELGLRAWATPAAEVRTVQAPRIPIDFNHDGRPIGELIFGALGRESVGCGARGSADSASRERGGWWDRNGRFHTVLLFGFADRHTGFP
jgi:hypothetical protein